MKVTLIDYTQDAVNKLLYTKATRLTQGEETRKRIMSMTREEKMQELKYMARTVPSSWEFVTYTFEILGVTRAFTHQLVRTRTGSYAQQAQRVNKMEGFTYEIGPTITGESKFIYHDCMKFIQNCYDTLIDNGVAVQDARGLLPTNIHTNIVAQFNLRALSDLVRKRWTARVQDEYRGVIVAMVEEVLAVHPWASDFLIPDKVAVAKELEDMISTSFPWHDEKQDIKVKMFKLIDLLRKD